METAHLWFHLPERDNKKKPTENPAYVLVPLQIHENPHYILGRSTVAPEGDKSSMTVTRFGGGSNPTSVTLKAESVPQRYPGKYTNLQGFATPGVDFDPVTRTLTFNQDGTQTVETNLKADAVNEAGGEFFVWSLSNGNNLLDVRTTTITDRANTTMRTASYGLSSLEVSTSGLPDVFGAVGSFFQWVGNGIASTFNSLTAATNAFFNNLGKPVALLPSPSQTAPVATLLTYGKDPKSPPIGRVALSKGSVSGLVGNDSASLVGNDSASLIAQGGGNLVTQGGGNLVGNDSASLIQLNNQALLPRSAVYTPSNYGTVISDVSYSALLGLRDQSGNLIANGGGN
jgi:hypothetical protein